MVRSFLAGGQSGDEVTPVGEVLLVRQLDSMGGPASVDEKDMACDHIGCL
jgi:hypothetical protein